jgi:hypothetical protein
MSSESKCSRCGGDVVTGKVHAEGRFAFRPTADLHAAKPRDIGIKATACRQCGHIDLRADLTKLAA